MSPDEGGRPGVREEHDHEDRSRSRANDADAEADRKEEDADAGDPSPKRPARGIFHSRLYLAGAIFLGVVAVAAIVAWWLHARHYEDSDDAFIDTHIVLVSAQISGRVSQIPVEDNQRVHKGQILVEIDPADVKAKLAQVEAQQDQAEKQYQQSIANEHGAEAQAENAQRDIERYRLLQQTAPRAVAQQQLDQATAAQRNTAAQLDAARAQIASAKAQINLSRAEVAAQELNLGYTHVVAPTDGHVAQRTVAVGDYVTPGQELMAIVPLEMWVTANFKETQLAHMRPGQPVSIDVDACPGVTIHAHVDSVQRGAGQAFGILPPENATGNYVKVVQRVPVKIVFDQVPNDCLLGPGMSVEPTVTVR
jgi:membrane fusion protein, multidrug efflux system